MATSSPLIGKLESIIDLKHSADKVFQVFSTQMHHLLIASDKIHSGEMHEGDWESPNSIKLWTYTIDGRPETFKEKVEVDEASKTVTLVALGGNVLERYKSYKVNLKVVAPKDGGNGFVELRIDFEKFKSDDPPPSDYLDFLISMVKDLDAHIPTGADLQPSKGMHMTTLNQ